MALQGGVISLTVEFAQGLSEKDFFGRQDPYCIIRCGNQVFRTRTHVDGGKNPVWNQTFPFNVVSENSAFITIMDSDEGDDDFVGTATIDFSTARSYGTDRRQVPVTKKSGKQKGLLSVSLTFSAAGGPPPAGAYPPHASPYGTPAGYPSAPPPNGAYPPPPGAYPPPPGAYPPPPGAYPPPPGAYPPPPGAYPPAHGAYPPPGAYPHHPPGAYPPPPHAHMSAPPAYYPPPVVHTVGVAAPVHYAGAYPPAVVMTGYGHHHHHHKHKGFKMFK